MEFSMLTPRLLLRDFRPEDWSEVHAYAHDPEVVKFMDWGPNSEAETRAFVDQAVAGARRLPRLVYDLAIVFQATGKVIGGATLQAREADPRIGELGYTLHRIAWGQGLATELAQALVAFGFTDLGLKRIWATCRPENIGSYRVLKKAGLRFEAYLQNNKIVRGQPVDSFLCALNREAWPGAPVTPR